MLYIKMKSKFYGKLSQYKETLRKNLSEKRKLQIKRIASFIPYRLRQGYSYRRWRRFISEAENYPLEKIREWQLTKLQLIVRYAYENISGYCQLYREAGVHPDDIRSLDDIQHLPLTTKQLFQDNIEAFTAKTESSIYITTGGSTGIPFGFNVSKDILAMERAFMHAGWERAGWKLGDRSAVLRGGYIGSELNPTQYDPYRRELNLSTYYLTAQSLPRYVAAIKAYRPEVIQAFPSALNLLADLMIESKSHVDISFGVILLGSENLYDWQIEKFEKVFPKTKIFSFYGHAELAILAPWCEKERTFHVWPFYGYTEIIDRDQREVANGQEGELVGTSFHNFATPFIRYKTMDYAIKGKTYCHSCARPYLILDKITGRSQEIIVSGRGRQISMTAINMHSKVFDNIKQFQFYQDKQGEVIFNIVRKKSYIDADTNYIRRELMKKLADDFLLTIRFVDDIPRTKTGKYRFLIQKMPVNVGDSRE